MGENGSLSRCEVHTAASGRTLLVVLALRGVGGTNFFVPRGSNGGVTTNWCVIAEKKPTGHLFLLLPAAKALRLNLTGWNVAVERWREPLLVASFVGLGGWGTLGIVWWGGVHFCRVVSGISEPAISSFVC